MSTPRIGIIGPLEDGGLQLLQDALVRQGGTVTRVDLGSFPGGLPLVVEAGRVRAGQADLQELQAIFVGRGEYMSPIPDWIPSRRGWESMRESIHEEFRKRQESRSVRASVLLLLSRQVPLVNHPRVHRASRLQPVLLRQLERKGLAVAPFVTGNDLEKMAHFVDAGGERCHARRLVEPAWAEVPADFQFLKEHHLDLDQFPLLLRHSMGGEQMHAAVVGGVCTGILCNEGGAWRPVEDSPARGAAMGAVGDVGDAAVRAAAAAGAHIAVVSLELDGEGHPWITGLDPEPDLLAIEREGGLDLAGPLARCLLEIAPGSGAAQQQPEVVARSRPPPDSGRKSRKARIGIAGQRNNDEVIALGQALEARGAEPVVLELPLFPEHRAIHECSGPGRMGGEDFARLGAIFLRTSFNQIPFLVEEGPRPSGEEWGELHSRLSRFLETQGECFPFRYAVLEILDHHIPVINPPAAQEVHRTKTWQLFSLMRAGLPVPPAMVGNDLEACRAFVEAQGGENRVVLKPLAGIYKTCLLSRVGLRRALEMGPVLLQRYVRGDTIRAYLAGGKVLGAGRIIHEGDSVDSSVEQAGVERVALPREAVEAGLGAARHLGLAWTGMDFLREEETGRHFILECNAAAMFANFARQTGMDIPGGLADLLIQMAQNCP